MPEVTSNEPGFATQPYTPTWPAAGTRTMSPGRAGRSRQPVMAGFLRSIIIGITEAPSDPGRAALVLTLESSSVGCFPPQTAPFSGDQPTPPAPSPPTHP